MKCRICKKELSNKISLKRRLGPVCYKKWKAGYRGIQIEPFEDIKEIERIIVK